MSDQFKTGDVVTLKSGGVKMTIEEIENGNVSCVWFDGTEPRRGEFPAVTLMKFSPRKARVQTF